MAKVMTKTPDVYEFRDSDDGDEERSLDSGRRKSTDCFSDSPSEETLLLSERQRSVCVGRSSKPKPKKSQKKKRVEESEKTMRVAPSLAPRTETVWGENHTVLCSARDAFVLRQDTCVSCGAVGSDMEGRLIACIQCGQCYHPYCAGVKVSHTVLLKGWRCLECTVCEGCGNRDEESRLILCDECDVSYHTFCVDPPLDRVPEGSWKCKWCACCETCGARDPGFNCTWQKDYTLCGPCASLSSCQCCGSSYQEGQLIVKCMQCHRWLHASCDSIRTEWEAERCADGGYNCLLCRPNDVPPPHLAAPAPVARKAPVRPTRTPSSSSRSTYLLDGVFLSEAGLSRMRSLGLSEPRSQRRRSKASEVVHRNPEAGILAAIESVVTGNSRISNTSFCPVIPGISSQVVGSPDVVPATPSPDTSEDVTKRKKPRYSQRFGIGGFVARSQKMKARDVATAANVEEEPEGDVSSSSNNKKRQARRKPKIKLLETFPAYLQEAFFGKELLGARGSVSEEEGEEDSNPTESTVTMAEVQSIEEESTQEDIPEGVLVIKVGDALEANRKMLIVKEIQELERVVEEAQRNSHTEAVVKEIKREPEVIRTDEVDEEALRDFLLLPTGELLDIDIDSIIGEEAEDDLKELGDTSVVPVSADKKEREEEDLDALLGRTDGCLPSMDGDEVEDVLKEVLQDTGGAGAAAQDFSIVATLTSSMARTDFSTPAVNGSTLEVGSPCFWTTDA